MRALQLLDHEQCSRCENKKRRQINKDMYRYPDWRYGRPTNNKVSHLLYITTSLLTNEKLNFFLERFRAPTTTMDERIESWPKFIQYNIKNDGSEIKILLSSGILMTSLKPCPAAVVVRPETIKGSYHWRGRLKILTKNISSLSNTDNSSEKWVEKCI